MSHVENKEHRTSRVWVLVVIAVGVLAGLALSIFGPGPRVGPGHGFFPQMEAVLTLRVILTTTSIALLVSLLVVYLRMYVQTKANFVLGLVVMLSALLLNSVLSHPLLLLQAEPMPFGPGAFLSTADVFTVVAYGVFLFLSLE